MTEPNTRRLIELLDTLVDSPGCFNGLFYDTVTCKHWDVGQAICRELYGPKWAKHPRFLADHDCLDVPLAAVEAAERWCAGEIPSWVLIENDAVIQ